MPSCPLNCSRSTGENSSLASIDDDDLSEKGFAIGAAIELLRLRRKADLDLDSAAAEEVVGLVCLEAFELLSAAILCFFNGCPVSVFS